MDHVASVQMLLRCPDIVPNTRTNTGWTCCSVAADHGSIEIVKLLLAHPQFKFDPGCNWPCFPATANNGHANVIYFLVNAGSNKPGFNVNVSNARGETGLQNAAIRGFEQVLEHMLSHPNIDPNVPRSNRDTALTFAIQNGHNTCVEMLLKHPKTDVNFAQKNPSILAALNEYCPPGVFAQFMAREDVDLNRQGTDPQTYEKAPISSLLMKKYTKFQKYPLREEEFREKILLLCKNKRYDMNSDYGVGLSPIFLSLSLSLTLPFI